MNISFKRQFEELKTQTSKNDVEVHKLAFKSTSVFYCTLQCFMGCLEFKFIRDVLNILMNVFRVET